MLIKLSHVTSGPIFVKIFSQMSFLRKFLENCESLRKYFHKNILCRIVYDIAIGHEFCEIKLIRITPLPAGCTGFEQNYKLFHVLKFNLHVF